ncbi:MAG: flippase-like domain-containing protein [Actinobacteria bacterium]|nr:flippase-like domain-containing protein [Actinomycetota bacterium]
MGWLRGSRLLKWLTYAAAAGALTYVVWNLRLSDLREGVSHMIWWAVVLAIILQIVPRLVQAWRWGYLLRPVKARLGLLLHAIYVSTLANGILPMCPSDLVRGVMVARRTRTGTVRVFSSQAVERAADGVALALVAWLAIRGLRVPQGVNQALIALVALVGAGMLVGLAMNLQHRRLHGYVDSRKPAGRVGKTFKKTSLELLAGAKAVKAWTMPFSITTGIGMVIMQIAVMWLMLYAYRINLSAMQTAALFGIITIGTLLPNAPASIGAWQFFCILGLGLFGVPASHAAGFSLVAFAIWTVPSLLLGVVALVVSPVSWADLSSKRKPESTEVQPA